ncbi:MAG: MGMT family protein [Chloroflexota bacterium]
MVAPPNDFRRQVYAIVRRIPSGRVMTYGGIAALIPPPSGMLWTCYLRLRARWVGHAMASCPDDLPWHRVVNAQGRISPRPGHGPQVQRILLEQEGVIFDGNGRIDLDHYGWAPPVRTPVARGKPER